MKFVILHRLKTLDLLFYHFCSILFFFDSVSVSTASNADIYNMIRNGIVMGRVGGD